MKAKKYWNWVGALWGCLVVLLLLIGGCLVISVPLSGPHVTHYNRGVVYSNAGKYEDAIEAFKQAIRIKPDFGEAHYNLGEAYFKIGDKESALKEYEILKTLDEDMANKLLELINK